MTMTRSLALCLALVATPALAHHGWSSYDSTKVMTIEGPVLESSYANPHGAVFIDHDGKRWEIVLAPPSRMNARGLAPENIAVGATVKVVGYPSTRHPAELRAERITAAGKTVELR
jgi:hypothetical protein